MKTIPLGDSVADVIDLAINEHLWNGTAKHATKNNVLFSCEAVYRAANRDYSIMIDIDHFLQSMGCGTNLFHEFDEIPQGKKSQYARALWLTWAAMIAREEGTMTDAERIEKLSNALNVHRCHDGQSQGHDESC